MHFSATASAHQQVVSTVRFRGVARMKLAKTLGALGVVFVACLLSLIIGTAVSASTITGNDSSLGAVAARDQVRCNWGFYNTGTRNEQRAYCYFSSTATGVVGSTHAGSNVTASFVSGELGADNGAVGAQPCAMSGTWHVGPQTWGTIAIPAQAAVFENGAAACVGGVPYVTSPYNQAWKLDTYSCTTGAIFVSSPNAFDYGCRGNYLGLTTLAAMNTKSWDGINYFPGGTSGMVVPVCTGLAVTGTSGSVLHYAGDTLPFSAAWTNTTTLYELSWRFAQAGSNVYYGVGASRIKLSPSYFYQVAFQPIGTGKSWNLVWPTGLDGESLLSAGLEFKCTSISAGVLSYYYFPYGGGSGFTTASVAANSCASASVKWPTSGVVSAGAIRPFSLSIPAIGAGTIDLIEYSGIDPAAAVVPTLASLTWSTATVIRNTAGAVVSLPATTANLPAGFSGVFTAVQTFAGDLSSMVIRCTSNTGKVTYNFQWFNAGVHTLTGEVTCLDSVTLTFSPMTWVPALVDSSVCVLEYVFVPSDASITTLRAAAVEITTKAPISYMAQGGSYLYTAMTSAPAEVAANRNNDFQLSSAMDVTVARSGHPSVHAVTPAVTGNFTTIGGSSAFSTMRTVSGVVFWIAAVWQLWQMTKRLVSM